MDGGRPQTGDLLRRLFRLEGNGTGVEAGIAVDLKGDRAEAEVSGRRIRLDLQPRSDGSFVALFEGGRVLRARVFPGRHETRVRVRGREMVIGLFDPREEVGGETETAAANVLAPMPGRVIEVKVARGDAVSKGDLLLILEAMKMQNEIRAEADGTVASVECEAGQAVEAGSVLIRF
jgi:acetyl/propionyl-CoA carboxylase alpha subunit